MFKKKIQCVTEQTIRKLTYTWAVRSACLPGGIKKKELLEQVFVVEDAVSICMIPPNTLPLFAKYVVFNKYLLCAYHVLSTCWKKWKKTRKEMVLIPQI